MTALDTKVLRDAAKPDAVATSLREALSLCLDEAHKSPAQPRSTDVQPPAASADAA